MVNSLQNPLEEGLAHQEEMSTPPQHDGNPNSRSASVGEPALTPTTKNKPNAVRSESKNSTKVAIPRQQSGPTPRYTRRVRRACESCNQRKTKCSGDTPDCRQCRMLRITCVYTMGWKDRTKRQFDKLSEKAEDYESMLKVLVSLVDPRTADQIRGLLDKYGLDVNYSSNNTNLESHSVTPQNGMSETDEPNSPLSNGSLEAIDWVEEDLNRNENSRATGYMGKNSEVTWMQRLQGEAEHRFQGLPGSLEPGQSKRQDNDLALSAVDYHLDDLEISVPGPVELYALPPQELADHLFDDYLRTVHPSFPIINRPLFTSQYRTFFESNAQPGDKWLAILNMIFAISSKHAHLIEASWAGDKKDHLVYLTRARILSMNGDVLFSHPDLQQVQVEGLIAFYLRSSDQINRAWMMSALAVRSAITLGINMKNSSPSTPNISKEARYRVWWCLYTFEHMLGIMTGRATCILDGVCTAPLPMPFEEEELPAPLAAEVLNNTVLRDERINNVMASASVQHMPLNPPGGNEATHSYPVRDNSWVKSLLPTHGLCYLYYCDLTVIAQEIVNKVYSVDCVMVPWTHIEHRISELRSKCDLWYRSLPGALDFTQKKDDGADVLRSKLALAFQYYSARITLGRPCLCRRDAQQRNPADKSSFSHDMAVSTLESAMRILDLVPDEPNGVRLYEISPWWCVLQYLMQAATVLLLELSFGSVHMPGDEKNFIVFAKKSVRWLYALSMNSVASRRAWQLCDRSLRKLATSMEFDIDDMPTATYQTAPVSTLDPTGIRQHPRHSSYITQNVDDHRGSYLEDLNLSGQSGHPVDHYFYSDFNAPTSSHMISLTADDQAADDLSFPYDPICVEFISSFFPHSNEEGPWGDV